MSAPEQNTPPAGDGPGQATPVRRWGAEVVATGGSGPTRTQRATVWTGCHLAELAAIGVTGSLAFTVTVWFAALTAVVVAVWAGQELSARRASRTSDTTSTTGTARDGEQG